MVAVLALGAGAGEIGLLQTAQTLPFLLLSIPAGVLADRASRRRLMASAEAVRALALVGTLVLAYLGGLTLPLLAMLGFVGACSVAAPALVPALVPSGALAAANARIELARTVAFVGGPALAGALVGWTDAGAAFGLAAALSVGAVVLLAGLREPARVPAATSQPLDDLREGAGFMFRHPLLLPILITQFVFNTAFFVLQAVYVPYAVHRLGLSASGVGVTLAIYGVGMVVGALLAPRIIGALRLGVVIVIGPIAGLASALVMVLTIWMPTAVLAGLSFFLIGVGPILWTISTATLRQMVTPERLLGRASAINIATYGSRPLGAAIGALVGGLYGEETGLVAAAAGFLVQAVVILVSSVRCLARPSEMVG
jgi:predicted MFS family arabinose efflux permease